MPNDEITNIDITGNLSCNDGQYLLNATLEGQGICFAPSIMLKKYINKGELCLLLKDYYLPKVSISAIYPLNRNLPKRVKLLLDFIHQELA